MIELLFSLMQKVAVFVQLCYNIQKVKRREKGAEDYGKTCDYVDTEKGI